MEEEHKCPPPGLPQWMGTFADLMSLLMCFFVLLLSFSEMDVLKFKQIAGSMKFAFGVQNMLEVKDIPKGTSVIAQEFRPGRPEPTPIEVIMQQTIDMTQRTLDFHEGESDRAGGTQREAGKLTGGHSADV
ncbi:flagellar motor protein MotB, partial [Photobacterium ganghwense]